MIPVVVVFALYVVGSLWLLNRQNVQASKERRDLEDRLMAVLNDTALSSTKLSQQAEEVRKPMLVAKYVDEKDEIRIAKEND